MSLQVNGWKIDLPVWIRFIIQVGLIMITASSLYFGFNNRLINTEAKVANLETVTGKMNENGTHRSHEMDFSQQTQIDENIRRIGNIESALRDLVPKVERIDANVLVLMGREKKM